MTFGILFWEHPWLGGCMYTGIASLLNSTFRSGQTDDCNKYMHVLCTILCYFEKYDLPCFEVGWYRDSVSQIVHAWAWPGK